MTAQDFIEKRLQELKTPSKEVPTFNSSDELHKFIFERLMSKKFRKFAVTPAYIPHIHDVIKNSIKNNEPIKLTFVFGGYKLWRLEETPDADWAELFSIMYFAKWLKPISEVYSPGIQFDFYSDDVIIDIMNNIPKKDVEKYILSFNKLLGFIKNFLPENLYLTLHRVGDQYDDYALFQNELQELIEIVSKELNGLPVLSDEQKKLVELNVKLKPEQGTDKLWREKIFLIHEAYARVSKRRPYYRTAEKIFVITRPIKDSIAVGTTKTSVAKFWVGAGALKKEGDSFQEYVLSPSQINSNATFESISIPGLEGKNFSKVRII